ncbi:hypothetical protein LGM98_04830 [Burkholderia metallica]|nr:hypothetical protein [Burkholderia metallica]
MSEQQFEQRALASVGEGAARGVHVQPIAPPPAHRVLRDLPRVGLRPPPPRPIELSDDELPY